MKRKNNCAGRNKMILTKKFHDIMPKHQSLFGFTLVELLVVISIIALLLSILIPCLQKARSQAGEVVCKSHLHQWGVILMTYTCDNDGMFFEGSTKNGFTSTHWNRVLYPLIGSKYYDSAVCPSARKPRSMVSPTEADYAYGGTYLAWGKTEDEDYGEAFFGEGEYGSYGINQWLTDEKAQSGSNPTGRGKDSWYYRSFDRIKKTNQVPMFADCLFIGSWPRDTDIPPLMAQDVPETVPETMRRFAIMRHRYGINIVFADQSVKNVTIKGLWGLKWHRCFNTHNTWTNGSNQWPSWIKD